MLGSLRTTETVEDRGFGYRERVKTCIIGSRILVLTWVLPGGYWICSSAKAEHSLSLCDVGHRSPFAAPSIVHVRTEGGPEIMTNLVNKDRLP